MGKHIGADVQEGLGERRVEDVRTIFQDDIGSCAFLSLSFHLLTRLSNFLDER